MNRKGISPLIAAVLLIAFTMAVASLFAQWAPQLMEDAQADTAEQAATQQACSQIMIDIDSVDAAAADDNTVTVSQTQGDSGVGDVEVTWFYENTVEQATLEAGENGLGELESDNNRQTATINSPNPGDDLDYVRVNPVECEGAPADEYQLE